MKKSIKKTVLTSIIVGVICLTPVNSLISKVASAEEYNEMGVRISEQSLKGNTQKVTLEVEEEEVKIEYTEMKNAFLLETETEDGEQHIVTYNQEDDYMIMDGEKVPIEIESYVEEEIGYQKITSTKTLLKASAWTPKYISTGKVKVSKVVNLLEPL